jgi:hypothetical protein
MSLRLHEDVRLLSQSPPNILLEALIFGGLYAPGHHTRSKAGLCFAGRSHGTLELRETCREEFPVIQGHSEFLKAERMR